VNDYCRFLSAGRYLDHVVEKRGLGQTQFVEENLVQQTPAPLQQDGTQESLETAEHGFVHVNIVFHLVVISDHDAQTHQEAEQREHLTGG
jgi:hypothetical protein